MKSLLQKLISRQLRRIPALLCVLAITVQTGLPLLHCWNEPSCDAVSSASGGLPLVQSVDDHSPTKARHDAASCPQCRLVSQSKALSPVVLLANAPLVRTAWVVSSPRSAASSGDVRGGGAPRAPPLLT